MFIPKRRQERNNWKDFQAQSIGQLFALFKHLGGKAGVERVLAGFPALSATVPAREVADTWMTVTVKTGYPVISSFYAAYLAESETQHGDQSPLAKWRESVAADSTLDEMKISLCRVAAKDLTGITKSLPRSVFFSLVRHPYRILPAEILAQLPTVIHHNPDDEWDVFLRMYAQPTVHDAAGSFSKLLVLRGEPRRPWRMSAEEWRMDSDSAPKLYGPGEVIEDPTIKVDDRILVMKATYKMEV